MSGRAPVLSSGALAIHPGFFLPPGEYAPFGAGNGGGGEGPRVGTLLGPEEAGLRPGLQYRPRPVLAGAGAGPVVLSVS